MHDFNAIALDCSIFLLPLCVGNKKSVSLSSPNHSCSLRGNYRGQTVDARGGSLIGGALFHAPQ